LSIAPRSGISGEAVAAVPAYPPPGILKIEFLM
jgi:hypothetical protein